MLQSMSKISKTPSRNINIDILKALAIFMVVWGHVLYNVAGITSGFISYVHMPVFYFASGLFIARELNNYSVTDFFVKKIKRLLIPYIIWSFISFAANSALLIAAEKAIPKERLIQEALDIFLYSRSVWFLIQLFIAELLFAFLYKFFSFNKHVLMLINTVVWALLIVFCTTDYFMMWKLKWLYPFLVIGHLFGDGNLTTSKMTHFVPSAVFAAMWAYMTYLFAGLYTTEGLFYGFDLDALDKDILVKELFLVVLGFVGVMAIYLLARILGHTPFKGFLAGLGNYTLDIYLIHMMLIFAIKKLPYKAETFGCMSAVYALAICIGIYLISKYILRKIKLFNLSIGM